MADSRYTYVKAEPTLLVRRNPISSLNVPSPDHSEIVQRFGGYGASMAWIRGSLITLFGEPQVSGTDLDEAFLYDILARSVTQQEWLLAVYATSSGIIIGGDYDDFSNREAARDLLNLLLETQPADFEDLLIDTSSQTQVIYGCQNGSCYWKEQEIDVP